MRIQKEKKKIASVSDVERGPCYSGQVSECLLYEDGTLGFTSGDYRCWGFYLTDYYFRKFGCTYWLAVENHLKYLREKENAYFSKIVSMCMTAGKWEFIKQKIQEDHEFVQKYGEPLEFVEIEIPNIPSPFCLLGDVFAFVINPQFVEPILAEYKAQNKNTQRAKYIDKVFKEDIYTTDKIPVDIVKIAYNKQELEEILEKGHSEAELKESSGRIFQTYQRGQNGL